MARQQSNSDSLPYTQVDRTAKPKATLLAGYLKVTPQHALGSLIEWWDLCGEPQELERIVEATPPGQEPARLLTKAEVELKFHLAAGCSVTVEALRAVGLIEPVGDEVFRVRGMSRYFDPIRARAKARAAAVRGGQRSAASRRESLGTAQPAALGSTSESASGALREHFGSTSEPASASGAAEPEVRRTLADSGQRTADQEDLGDLLSPLSKGGNEKKPREPSVWEVTWAECEELRRATLERLGRPYAPQALKPARVNQLLRRAATLLGELDPDADEDVDERSLDLASLFRRYVWSAYWRDAAPPFPLEGFCAEATLRRLVDLAHGSRDPVKLEGWYS